MFEIRASGSADIAAVGALLARSYPQLLAPDYETSVLKAALPVMIKAQPELVGCGTYYLVEEDGAVLGAGGWTAAAPASGTIIEGAGHIRHVVTDHRAVRRGVGRALMDHIFAESTAQGVRHLDCLATLTAVPFYRAMGFVAHREVKVPLGPQIQFPAVEMKRLL